MVQGSRWCKNGTRGTGGGRVVHRVHVKQEWYTGFIWCKGATYTGSRWCKMLHGAQLVQG
jgi:hypothetical protein